MLLIGLSALALSGAGAPASAATNEPNRTDPVRAAARAHAESDRAAARAARALARGRPAVAVLLAERAVELCPGDAGHRAVLGRSYLRAGRFASARDALTEVLALNPGDAAAALNLALAQVATGDPAAARATLDAHAGAIPQADLGLALTLAGEPEAGARVLMHAARAPGASARTRQNLALALALGGNWQMARAVAAADLQPSALDARIMAWVAMANPAGPADQVAQLLDVVPAADPGRPAVLALVTPPPSLALASAPVRAPLPSPEPAAAPAAAPVAAPKVVFAARREVVQALPARSAGKRRDGRWVVQLGAFGSEEVARRAWNRARRHFAGFNGAQPVVSGRRGLVRVSVRGFSRAEASDACRRYRDAGGSCYVRTFSGDRLAAWLQEEVRVASR